MDTEQTATTQQYASGTIGFKRTEKIDPIKEVREKYKAGLQNQLGMRQQWLEVSQNYHGFVANRVKGRSNFHHHKIYPQVERATARFMQYYFRAKPFVSIAAAGENWVDQAKNHERVLQHYYERCPVFYLEKTRLVKYVHMFGCGFQVPSWKTVTRDTEVEIPHYATIGGMQFMIGSHKQLVKLQLYDGPWFTTYSPSEVFFDQWSMGQMRWGLVEEWVHYSDLIAMAQNNQYDENAVNNVPLNGSGQDESAFRIRQTSIGRPKLDKDVEMVRLQHLFFADHFYTLANDAVLVRDSENWFDHGQIPIIKGQAIIDPDSPYPMATGVLMLPVQKMINLTDNLLSDHTMQSVNWQWKYKNGVDPNQLLGLPNHRIGPLKNMEDVDIIVPPEVKHDLLLVNAAFQSASDELVGYYSSQKGADSGPSNTATSDTIFQQEGNIRIASDIRNFEEMSQVPEAKQTSKSVAQMMPDDIEVAVEDMGGQAFQRLTRDQIQGEFAYSASGASETINRAVAQQQISDFFALAKDAQQYVMLPTGAIVPMPVTNAYEYIKDFLEGMGKRNVSKLLYNPLLFGQPLDNSRLAQTAPVPPDYLTENPQNGGMVNPAMLMNQGGAGVPGGNMGGGGGTPSRSLTPARQIRNTSRSGMGLNPVAGTGRGAF